jgi:hypothetical protein
MNKVLDSIKEFFAKAVETVSAKIDKKKIRRFFRHYGRYLMAGVLLLILFVVLYQCTGPEKARTGEAVSDTEATQTAEFVLDDSFEQDAHEEINTLITNYYTAYAAGNTDELAAYAYPITDNEKSYIVLCSQFQEAYQNISCYTKSGLTDGSYFVSVCYDLKFYDVETAAPGLDFFYVETDENGALYINNLYSGYNRERMEEDMDPDVYAAYVQYRQQDDLQAIREEVQQRYQDALSTDVNLVNMLSTVFPEAVDNWKNTVLASADGEDQTEAVESTEAEGTESPSEENTDAAAEEIPDETVPEETVQETVQQVEITGESLNVRAEASKDSENLGKAPKGSVYTKLGESGEWTQIDYNGTAAYVKTEYVKEVTN